MRARPSAASPEDEQQQQQQQPPPRPQSPRKQQQQQPHGQQPLLQPEAQQQGSHPPHLHHTLPSPPADPAERLPLPSPSRSRTPDDALSFSSSKFDAARHSDTIDRRKAERGIKAHLAQNEWELPPPPQQQPPSYQESEQLQRKQAHTQHHHSRPQQGQQQQQHPSLAGKAALPQKDPDMIGYKSRRWRSPWRVSLLTLLTSAAAALVLTAIVRSFLRRQVDPKGCNQCYMWPAYAKLDGFDTEHTRFASKYSLYLYREVNVDEEPKVKGVPVLFITGNAGSYKQVRPIASEAAHYFAENVQQDADAIRLGASSLDFFTADFNEDITAFHGQTLLDQAEYLNDAVAYILSLYHDPRRSRRDPGLPDPTSVIVLGHSMGGIVARTMLVMPNYQSNSINTIVTMSTPHARPPVSFDAQIIATYQAVNDYWRRAYSQKWANDNPLWHVTLVSIAGGGLDTIVPSDYASLASLVPDTHGFTVFTSSIPGVWTGSDHLSILWCDQFRKVMVRALMGVVDANRPGQTKPRAHRMKVFKKWFLTGMERVAEKSLPDQEPTTLLTLEDNSNSILGAGERLSLQGLGAAGKPKAYLLPVPPHHTGANPVRFNLLSDQPLDTPGASGTLEVLFCSVFPLHHGHSASLFSMNIDLSDSTAGSTRLACKNAAADVIKLPASTRSSVHPFDDASPFSFLQFDGAQLAEHQFVAVVDKGQRADDAWVMAEFSDAASSVAYSDIGLWGLFTKGLRVTLPAGRPIVSEIRVPAIYSSLLAYSFKLGSNSCGDGAEKFTPMLRQHLAEPFESKFFVNVKEANINLHGMAPFMPPPLRAHTGADGLSLQVWSDPTCNSSAEVSLRVDVFGSLGKLYMRYRTVFPAIPLVIVALVLRKQFMVHDQTGVFMPFTEALDLCLRSSLPMLMLAMTIFGASLAMAGQAAAGPGPGGLFGGGRNASEPAADFSRNDLLLGSQDPFFWFLVPVAGLVCVGICVAVNHLALLLVHGCALAASAVACVPTLLRGDDLRRAPAAAFASPSPRRRVAVTAVLLFLVATIIPYQFAYMVACVVQVATCTRALCMSRETRSGAHANFSNYAHSALVLMLWVLPINVPVLIVWWHNLAVHWLTPFSSHHNVLSIMPFILLVETLTAGKMLPRLSTQSRHITNILFFFLAVYAALYGVTFAYQLHHLANLICAWLVVLHFSTANISAAGLSQLLDGDGLDAGGAKKRP